MNDLILTERKSLDNLINQLFEENINPEKAGNLLKEDIEIFFDKNKASFQDTERVCRIFTQEIPVEINFIIKNFYRLYEQVLDDRMIDLKKKHEKITRLYREEFIIPLRKVLYDGFAEVENSIK